MNAGQSWAATYKPGELVVVSKPFMGELSRLGLGLLTRCDIPPAGGLQIPVVEVLIFGKIVKCSLGEIRHMTPKEIKQGELGAGINENLLDNEALNNREDAELFNMPGVGELAYPIGEHINYHSAPMLVVEHRTVKEMDLESEDTEQAFFVDNRHGITWFDELPDETPLLKVVIDGQFFWIPGTWTTKIPNEQISAS